MSGIPCYLPRLNRTYINSFAGANGRKYSYKRAPVLVPMFPGYIFAALNIETIGQTRCRSSVAQVCPHRNYTEEELVADLRKVQEFEFFARENQIEVKPEIISGSPVVISTGIFKGCEGIVEKRIDRNFVFIRITSVGFSLGINAAIVDCDILPAK